MNEPQNKKWFLLVCVTLILVTFFAFEQVRHNDFINYDDRDYVANNQTIQAGLTLKNIKWAFTEPHFFMWHPMTSLSHMLDCELFGLKPGWHHLTSLTFHIASALLLFGVLKTMTGRLWPSAFVAAAFALHPLNVESVAWAAERKSVLSGFFWMLTIAAYVRYAKRQRIADYLLVVLVFSFALMSKPITVTLPFVLLLLDYWPLNRLENISLKEPSSRQTIFRLAREKIPLFVLSAICSTITFLAQRSGGTVAELAKFPLGFRLANAVLSYAKYIGNTFWPKDLAVFYPLSGDELSSGWVLFPLAFLLVASIRVVQFAPNHRYLPVGWFWFLGTLVPVIGIVQSGSQALADRYAYIPLVGLFIITVWGFDEYFPKIRYRKAALGLLALMSLSALTICTRIQVRFWQNSITLWEQTLKVTQNNGAVHDNFATALAEKGRYEEAIEHYRIALKMLQNPDSDMLYNIGCVYSNLERYTEAVEPFRQAIKIKPDCIEAYIGLGKTLGMLGRHTEVIEVCQQAIKIKPDSAEAYFNLGAAYISQSRWAEAIEATKQAVRIKPASAQAHYNLGLAFLNAGDKNSALRQYDILKQLDPHFADALLRKIQK